MERELLENTSHMDSINLYAFPRLTKCIYFYRVSYTGEISEFFRDKLIALPVYQDNRISIRYGR